MVTGWGGHREGTRFESQWGQRMKERKSIPMKKKVLLYNLYLDCGLLVIQTI